MKIRILNGGHAAIAYPAGLLGIAHVHDAMADADIAGYLDVLERTEIIPHVPAVPGTNLADYHALIARRFANPDVGDTIRRLCLDGSSRQPKFIVATLRDALAANGKIDGLALESALWCRYCRGTTEAGAAIEPNDPKWDRLQATAKAAAHDPEIWLAMTDVYGNIGEHPRLRSAFATALRAIDAHGVTATLRAYCAGETFGS